jgi:chemotaxis methyl-accepting protein methylase
VLTKERVTNSVGEVAASIKVKRLISAVVYVQKYVRSIPVAYVNVIATGSDAFIIDEAKITEIPMDKFGSCEDWSSAYWRKHYGQDNHGVYCISTDTTDKVNFASAKCHKEGIGFYVQAYNCSRTTNE